MNELAILVVEQPWDAPAGGTRRLTVRPFFEGLEKIHCGVAMYYSTFHDGPGLRSALAADLLLAREPRQVLYIGSHGSRGRVGGIRLDVLRRILDDYQDRMHQVEGIIISSCDVFQSRQDLGKLIAGTHFRWAMSYSCAVGWFDSMLIELAVLNALAENSDPTYRRSQAGLKIFFQQALSLLNHQHPLEHGGTGTIAENLVVAIKARVTTAPCLLSFE